MSRNRNSGTSQMSLKSCSFQVTYLGTGNSGHSKCPSNPVPSKSASNILNNTQQQIDAMAIALNEEPATISDDDLSSCSEDDQSALIISDSDSSD